MKLQLTNGYHVHFDQISRILQYLLTTGNRKKIPRQEIVATLGLSDRQVENLISVSVGFGLVKSRTSVLTPLGKIIEENGGKVTGSVSGGTDYLLCGADPGSKRTRADKLGITVIDEDQFRKLI